MKKRESSTRSAADLRRRAEVALKALVPPAATSSREDLDRLLHELQVHQVELELQNEELRRARVEAEEALARYSELYDFAPVGYLTLDRTGRIHQANLAAAQLLGAPRSALQRHRLPLLVDQHSREALTAGLQRLFAGAEQARCEVVRSERGSATCHLLIDARRVGDADLCQVILIDITARTIAERESRMRSAALNSAADAIFITDPNGVIVWVNEAFTQQTGYGRAEAVGSVATTLLGTVDTDDAQQLVINDTLLEGGVWRGERTTRRKDGTTYREQRSVTPIRDDRESLSHIITIGRDLTHEHELESQLRQAQKLETVGLLAGGVAHDFNNLLTIINGSASLILNELARDHPSREGVQEILTAGERAAELTRQLLVFSRRQVTHPEPVEVGGFLSQSTGMLRRLIGDEVRLVVRVQSASATVLADRTQLHQIVMNLAVNSRDAMPAGGTLTVTVEDLTISRENEDAFPGAVPGHYVLLTIMDTGEGMSAETSAHVFEPFFTTKELGKGTGLGLSTVYGIVKQSHGFIWLHSVVGESTTVRIALPAISEPAGATVSGESDLPARGTETVLVADDDPSVRSLAARVLRAAGYTVLEAVNGVAALAVLETYQGRIHLLFSDLVMPEMGGRELKIRATARRPFLRVLLTSGYSEKETPATGASTDETPFLPKPYNARQLRDQVRAVLDAPPVAY